MRAGIAVSTSMRPGPLARIAWVAVLAGVSALNGARARRVRLADK